MNKKESKAIIPVERIEGVIYIIRGNKVLLDRNLASLYGVETKKLIQAVKRNRERFPEDFMFQLTKEELENWKSQIVTSNLNSLRSQIVTLDKPQTSKRGKHFKYLPYAFTEQGVAMLSSVLRSPQAVAVNVEIMRAFVRLRQILASHKEITKELAELKAFLLKHSNENTREFQRVWQAIEKLENPPPPKEQRRIGFDLGQGQ